MAQAKTQLDTAQVQDTDIAVARARFEHAIAVLSGKPPPEFGLAPSRLGLAPPRIPVGLPPELLERRADIAAAERRAAEANEQIGIAISAYYPSVAPSGITGAVGTSPASWFNWPSLLWLSAPRFRRRSSTAAGATPRQAPRGPISTPPSPITGRRQIETI